MKIFLLEDDVPVKAALAVDPELYASMLEFLEAADAEDLTFEEEQANMYDNGPGGLEAHQIYVLKWLKDEESKRGSNPIVLPEDGWETVVIDLIHAGFVRILDRRN